MDSRTKYYKERSRRNYKASIRGDIITINVTNALLFTEKLTPPIEPLIREYMRVHDVTVGRVAFEKNNLDWVLSWKVQIDSESALMINLKKEIFFDDLITIIQDYIDDGISNFLDNASRSR